MDSLMDAYDMAQQQDTDRVTCWVRFCGADLGVAAEDEQVRVWAANDTETKETFDTETLNIRQFMREVETFVHERVLGEVSP